MIQITGPQPNINRLRREASVTKAHDRAAARSQDSGEFSENLLRSRQIVHRNSTSDHVKALVGKRERRVHIQVPQHRRLCGGRILLQLGTIHAHARYPAAAALRRLHPGVGVVGDVRGAEVEGGAWRREGVVVLGQGADGEIIYVKAETRLAVEYRVRGGILALKTFRREGPFFRPSWALQDFARRRHAELSDRAVTEEGRGKGEFL